MSLTVKGIWEGDTPQVPTLQHQRGPAAEKGREVCVGWNLEVWHCWSGTEKDEFKGVTANHIISLFLLAVIIDFSSLSILDPNSASLYSILAGTLPLII